MTADLLARLRSARAVLGGVDRTGAASGPSMFSPDVISFAHGDGTRRPHPAVIAAGVAALLDSERGALDDYLFLRRHEQFDAAVTADFIRTGIPADSARNVCVDSGTTRLFAAFLKTVSQPGDLFLVPRSYYHPLPNWCDLYGVRLALVPTRRETEYKLSADDLEAWFARNRGDRARGLFLFNPTQTGALYSPAELTALAGPIADHNLLVLEDAVFAGTEFPGEPPVCHLAAAVPALAGQTVTLKGASKGFNLANIRIGWGCGPEPLIRMMNEHTVSTLATVPYLAKAMALAALRAPQGYLLANSTESARRAALIAGLVDECNRELQRWADRPVLDIPHRPRAGHGILVGAPGLAGRALPDGGLVSNSIDLARYLLSSARVATSPGYSLGFDQTELRLAFGSVGLRTTYAAQSRAELAAAIDAVTTLCRERRAPGSALLEAAVRALQPADSPAPTDIFAAGRRLIIEAFHDRIVPALTRLLARTKPSRTAAAQ